MHGAAPCVSVSYTRGLLSIAIFVHSEVLLCVCRLPVEVTGRETLKYNAVSMLWQCRHDACAIAVFVCGMILHRSWL